MACSRPRVLRALVAACARVRCLQLEIAELEAERKRLMTEEVEPRVEQLGLERLDGDGWALLRVPGARTSIAARTLLELGVEQSVIDDATEVKIWETWQVRGTGPAPAKEARR